MPIEFRCGQCERLLRVPDQTAGAQARCPQCGQVQTVPEASSGSSPSASDSHNTGQAPSQSGYSSGNPFEGYSTPPAGSTNPFAERQEHNPYADNSYESPYSKGYQPNAFSRDEALSKVMAPAIIQIVIGVLAVLVTGFVAIMGLIDAEMNGLTEDAIVGFLIIGVGMLVQLIVIVGSVRMLSLKNYSLAFAAALLSLICGMCNILTLAIGIWSLVVLSDSNVKSHFT